MSAVGLQRISICQFTTFRWSFFQDVIKYASHGFEKIGLWNRKLDDFGVGAASDLLYEMGLSVSSVHWVGGFTGDGRSYAAAIDEAMWSIHAASQLGADSVLMHPGARNGHTEKNQQRLWQKALNELLPVAADYGVNLAVEMMTRKQAPRFTTFSSTENIFDTLAANPALKVVLDTYHVGFDENTLNRLDEIASQIALVQLADRRLEDRKTACCPEDVYRLPLGEGQIDFQRWLKRLNEVGYRGDFEIEVHGCETQKLDYQQILERTSQYLSTKQMASLLSQPSRQADVRTSDRN